QRRTIPVPLHPSRDCRAQRLRIPPVPEARIHLRKLLIHALPVPVRPPISRRPQRLLRPRRHWRQAVSRIHPVDRRRPSLLIFHALRLRRIPPRQPLAQLLRRLPFPRLPGRRKFRRNLLLPRGVGLLLPNDLLRKARHPSTPVSLLTNRNP